MPQLSPLVCRRKLATIASVSVIAVLVGCDGSGASTNSNSTASTATTWDTTYSLAARLIGNNEIAVDHPTTIDLACSYPIWYTSLNAFTAGDSLLGTPALFYDTLAGGTDTSVYRIESKNLLISLLDTSYLPNSDTSARFWTVFDRASGIGLTGAWNSTFMDSVEFLGAASSSGWSSADSQAALLDMEGQHSQGVLGSGTNEQVTFSANSVRFQIHYGSWAQLQATQQPQRQVVMPALSPQLQSQFSYLDAPLSDSIDVQTISDTTVVFTGLLTREVVTETYLSRGVYRISSSDSIRHPAYTWYDHPTSASQCPEVPWFYAFVLLNQGNGGVSTLSCNEIGCSTPRWQTWKLPL
jgi:hypothetical protein